MDNLTHSLAGWTLGQTGLKRKSRKGLAALILGANMPDVDVFLGWVPWTPLATHRGWTHSLVGGVLLMPPLLAGLLWMLDRWQASRGIRFTSGLEMRFGWLLALAYLGTLTHPLLDWQTSYAIQLFSPFDLRWYHTDSLFIIDIWLWLLLGLAIWLSIRREAAEYPRWERPAITAAVAACAYIAANAGLSAMAARSARERGADPQVIVAGPPPALFWRRDLLWKQGGFIWRAHYDPLATPSLTGLSGPLPDGLQDSLARRSSRATPEVARFLRWSILPLARIERTGCQARVRYNDARFADGFAADRFWVTARVRAC